MIEVAIPASAELIAEGNFNALIKIYGFSFACAYVAGKFDVRNVSGQRYTLSRPKWQIQKNADAARAWLAEQVANLGADFHASHNALYELAEAA